MLEASFSRLLGGRLWLRRQTVLGLTCVNPPSHSFIFARNSQLNGELWSRARTRHYKREIQQRNVSNQPSKPLIRPPFSYRDRRVSFGLMTWYSYEGSKGATSTVAQQCRAYSNAQNQADKRLRESASPHTVSQGRQTQTKSGKQIVSKESDREPDVESIATSVSKYLHLPILPHRPTKEELLAAASGFSQRLKVRFKWMSIRSMRPWNADEWGAFVSWVMLGHIVWILVGTTTFFSLLIFSINTVFAQGELDCISLSRLLISALTHMRRNSSQVDWGLSYSVRRRHSNIRVSYRAQMEKWGHFFSKCIRVPPSGASRIFC